MTVLTLLNPIDQIIWTAQNRMVTTSASGDIIFISSQQDLSDPEFPSRRVELAQLVRQLNVAGAESIYIDSVFDTATTAEIDNDLNSALLDFGPGAYLVQDVRTGLNGQLRRNQSISIIAHDVNQVGGDLFRNFMGYVWDAPYVVGFGENDLPNLAAQIAGTTGVAGERFPIGYDLALDTIPVLSLQEARSGNGLPTDLRDKIFVIGSENRADGRPISIPGLTDVSPTLIHVYAAETLMAGRARYIGGAYVTFFAFALLLAIGQIQFWRWRRIAYGAIVVAILIGLIVAAHVGWRVGLSGPMGLIAIYAIFRLRSLWKDSFTLIDADTNLPTFAALEADSAAAETLPAIIVAKIHRFEQVRRTLPKELHSEYLLRIIGRLKAATQDATIYLGQGHLIAWTLPEKEPALLHEHLEGLRALFSSPLIVGDQQVDVGITFGVDITPSPNVSRRLASAVAVAELTNETFEPIAIADTTSDEDLIWNISLQARIDAALSNGEIYLVYQPKVMVQTGEIVGVEALVRWNDPVRGHIPPDNFIRQCETAGRMSHLTRFVLEEACKAGNAMENGGLSIPVAVNISATLVHEHAIVDLVSEVLRKTGFEPRRLTLEITETYRISNLDRAAEILGELKALGAKISMDDFGVGAASLEALLRLPFGELKIDRLFIAQMANDEKAAGIVRNVLQLGKDLRIIVVAEGVEDTQTLTILRDSGCLVAQGFGISRPIPIDKLLDFHKDKEKFLLKNMV
ncbi:EAL domain-containing protein [Aurantiacibacter marinus]|uniref:EAL domain-containing protein n=1 Tax=Aurantiacibacter marinus TaxID=874156 RepID=UPI0012E01812|nr:EAL domain-containing protein [Aurantiacibacter marinus]